MEEMLKVNQESSFSYAFNHHKKQFVALAAACFLCVTIPLGISIGTAIDAENYHAAITEGGLPLQITDSTGDKFVLYNPDTNQYFRDNYLPEQYQAANTSEVAGVLKVNIDTEKVGTYGSVGNAYKYYVTISLYDCTTGEVFGNIHISGGEPPRTIRTKGLQTLFGKDGYGSKPNDEAMENACMRLIESYQASR